MAKLEMYTFIQSRLLGTSAAEPHLPKKNAFLDVMQSHPLHKMHFSHYQVNSSCLLSYYLRVSDTDDTFYEAILFCGLEDRHTVLSILLHSLGTTIRPILVAHLLQ